jgi:hypothetical protein
MYRCEICGGISKPKERSCLVTVETRLKEYPHNDKTQIKEGSTFGKEIVREKRICQNCKDNRFMWEENDANTR